MAKDSFRLYVVGSQTHGRQGKDEVESLLKHAEYDPKKVNGMLRRKAAGPRRTGPGLWRFFLPLTQAEARHLSIYTHSIHEWIGDVPPAADEATASE